MPGAAHHAKAAPRPAAALIRLAVDAYLAIRVSALAFTLLLPLLGAASSQRGLAGGQALLLVGVGLAFHIFAYVLNDAADLRVDRTEPLRADSPLVRGVLSLRTALWLAWLQLPLALALALVAGATPASLSMLGLAFLALAGYDWYGKRCPWPLLTDAVQGLGWCALLLFGAFLETGAARADLPWVLSYVFFYVLLVNGLHGGVRDLANDMACGARTTAAWLGARPDTDSRVTMPCPLIGYALALQAALVVCAILALRAIEAPAGSPWVARLVVLPALAAAALVLGIGLARASSRRSLISVGAVHIVLSLAVLPALYLPLLEPAGATIVATAFALPVALMYLYNGSHWRL